MTPPKPKRHCAVCRTPIGVWRTAWAGVYLCREHFLRPSPAGPVPCIPPWHYDRRGSVTVYGS